MNPPDFSFAIMRCDTAGIASISDVSLTRKALLVEAISLCYGQPAGCLLTATIVCRPDERCLLHAQEVPRRPGRQLPPPAGGARCPRRAPRGQALPRATACDRRQSDRRLPHYAE